MTATATVHRIDVERIRADFPILQQVVNGYPLVYLDNAATTQKPRQVIEALVRYYETTNANIHRGIHTLSMRATDQYEGVRGKVARHIGAQHLEHVIFTRNTTEAINLVAHAWGSTRLKAGDEIVLTEMEHHSNIVPWQLLAARTGAAIRYIRVNDAGYLDPASIHETIGPRTRIVSVVHASNVLGTINPVAEIARLAQAQGAVVLVDGAQSAGHLPVDVEALGCDFFAFSAHKMLGPTGVGVLWGRGERLNAMDPFLGGGDMISIVREDSSTWAELPHKFEAGTPNIADVIAFGAALDYLAELGAADLRAHEEELTAYAMDALRRIDGLSIHGPTNVADRVGAVSFKLGDVHPRLATLDPFLEDIDARVITTAEFGAGAVDEDLDELRARRPMPHRAVPFVGDHVAHERLVGIRRVKNPVGVGRKPEDGHGRWITFAVEGLYGEGAFRIAQRGASADVEQCPHGEGDRLIEAGSRPFVLDELQSPLGLLVVRDAGAKGVHDDQRQVGIERGEVVVEQRVRLCAGRAWRSVRRENFHAHEQGVGNLQRSRVGRRILARHRAVQRVTKHRRAVAGGEMQDDVGGVSAAWWREDDGRLFAGLVLCAQGVGARKT